jgi:hypothetical protein
MPVLTIPEEFPSSRYPGSQAWSHEMETALFERGIPIHRVDAGSTWPSN